MRDLAEEREEVSAVAGKRDRDAATGNAFPAANPSGAWHNARLWGECHLSASG
jgi:hypothetical protein